MNLPNLTELLLAGTPIRGLGAILKGVLGGGDLKDRAKKLLDGRLEEQSGRTSGKLLGRAVCEQIDSAMESDFGTVDQRAAVGNALAQNAALQLAEAGEAVLAYGPLAEAVIRAKASGNADELAQARAARNAGTDRVKQSLVDVGRVVAGDRPQEGGA